MRTSSVCLKCDLKFHNILARIERTPTIGVIPNALYTSIFKGNLGRLVNEFKPFGIRHFTRIIIGVLFISKNDMISSIKLSKEVIQLNDTIKKIILQNLFLYML